MKPGVKKFETLQNTDANTNLRLLSNNYDNAIDIQKLFIEFTNEKKSHFYLPLFECYNPFAFLCCARCIRLDLPVELASLCDTDCALWLVEHSSTATTGVCSGAPCMRGVVRRSQAQACYAQSKTSVNRKGVRCNAGVFETLCQWRRQLTKN